MSNNIYLNWAIIAVSLFNAILLGWLGLTVLLNAARRDWGVWLGTIGLLLGSLFFISHTTIAAAGLFAFSWRSMIFWWTVGLIPVIMLPFAWYIIVLWYVGFWNLPHPPIFYRQRYPLLLTTLMLFAGLGALFIGTLLLAIPLSILDPVRIFIRWSIAGIPFIAVGYAAYILLCIGLSADALRHPADTGEVMGMIGRQRARPYLIGASVTLLVISLLVVTVMLQIVNDARQRTFIGIYLENTLEIALIDLLVSSLIAVVVLLVGQGIVSYEVFTSKTLPRRGLYRQWHRAILLGAGYGVVIGASVAFNLRPLYGILLATLIMVVFYAMFSWRAYAEREKYIASLRPFVSSQNLVDQLLTQSVTQPVPDVDINAPFQALCVNVLDTQLAYLTAVGPLAPLVGNAIAYPHEIKMPSLADLITQAQAPDTLMLPINPNRYAGAMWAVPLWSERGMIGLLLLGEKSGNGLYTQEEIEIARVTGERLIDTQASNEIARRLMGLQRQRLAQTQIIDQQTRRVLHDDILPNLQAAMIALSSAPDADGQIPQAMNLMTDAHRQISDLLHSMPTTSAPEVARIGLVKALRRAIDDELPNAFDEITWQIPAEVEQNVLDIPTLSAEVIFYATREVIRNAAKHGRGDEEERPLNVTVKMDWNEGLTIAVIDDGVGMGNSPSENGSGHGLALHTTMMAVIGGEITVDSHQDEYTQVLLTYK